MLDWLQMQPILDWLQGLSSGTASFLGSLAGVSIGLIALVLGGLFNAYLNRRRDDRIRRQDARAVAVALHAELNGICRTLEDNALELNDARGDFVVPDVAHSIRVLPEMLPKIGLLDLRTVRQVLDAYVIIEQYHGNLTMRSGSLSEQTAKRRLIAMTKEQAPAVAWMNETMAVEIRKALKSLYVYLQNA